MVVMTTALTPVQFPLSMAWTAPHFFDEESRVQANDVMVKVAADMLDALVRTESALRSLRATS